jgi:prevent-host-death family protein
MPIANVRKLQQSAKALLERVERDREPFVITRHGRPVAALVPIDPDDAERYLISTAPSLLETRRRAEAGSGETQPLQEMASEFGVKIADDAEESADRPGSDEAAEKSLLPDEDIEFESVLRSFVGERLAKQVGREADGRLYLLSKQVLSAAETAGLGGIEDRDQVARRVQALNRVLLLHELRKLLAELGTGRLRALSSGGETGAQAELLADGVFGGGLTEEALEQAVTRVSALNQRFLALAERQSRAVTIDDYELSLAAGIETLQGVDTIDA